LTDAKRTLAASLMSPALIPAAVLAFALVDGVSLRESIVLAGIYAVFTYSGTFIFGIPIHLVLDRIGLRGLVPYALSGALAAVAILLGFFVVEQNVTIDPVTVAMFGGAGALTAAVFWAILRSPAGRARP
jgi:hypothetical protein